MRPLKKFYRKIRLWNPRYFANPLYSPSLAFAEAGEAIGEAVIKGIAEGFAYIENGGTFEGFSPEVWSQIQQSAAAVTFFYNESAEGNQR